MKIKSKLFQLTLLLLLVFLFSPQEGRAVYEYSITAVKKNSNGSNGLLTVFYILINLDTIIAKSILKKPIEPL